jgi:signal peptidase II
VRELRRQEGVRPYLLALPVAGAVVAADLWTKRIAAASFADGPLTVIPGILTFTYGENPGASFSMFQGGGPFLAMAAVIAVVVVLAALRHPRPTSEVIAFGLIMGGAAGNLADRVFRAEGFLDGHVIDWIQFPNFPIFNIADSAITISVVLLFMVAWSQSRSHKMEA